MTGAAVAKALIVAALAGGADADPSLYTPGDATADDGARVELSSQRHMQACDSGGMGAPTCEVNCHIVFNLLTTSCGVSCRPGYFACCSCDDGCHCLMDHEEMWPLPDPPPQP